MHEIERLRNLTSQSCAIRSQSKKNREICEIRAFDFLNCESTCDLTDVSASIYDRKIDARPFDTIHDIQRFHGLVQSIGNRLVNINFDTFEMPC